MMFIKYAAFHLQHLNLWKNQKNTDGVNDTNAPVSVCWIYIRAYIFAFTKLYV